MSLYLLLVAVAVFWSGVSLSRSRFVGNEMDEAAQIPFMEDPELERPAARDDRLQA
jgi:hypothetical protein